MAIDIISLTIALSSLIIGIVSHIKHSKCLNCIDIEMKDQNIQQILDEKKKLLHNIS